MMSTNTSADVRQPLQYTDHSHALQYTAQRSAPRVRLTSDSDGGDTHTLVSNATRLIARRDAPLAAHLQRDGTVDDDAIDHFSRLLHADRADHLPRRPAHVKPVAAFDG